MSEDGIFKFVGDWLNWSGRGEWTAAETELVTRIKALLKMSLLIQHVEECEVCRIVDHRQIYCSMAEEIRRKDVEIKVRISGGDAQEPISGDDRQ